MVVTIEGCYTPKMKDVLIDATHYFGTFLFSSRIVKNIDINLIVRSNMREHGLCGVVDYNSINRARSFEIELRKKRSIRSMVQTLAHEMVHAKQYAHNEMNEMDSTWKGKRVNVRRLNYVDWPWEVEAFGMEVILLKSFEEESKIDFKKLEIYSPVMKKNS